MKTALCLIGTGRSIEYTFNNLKNFLIDDIESDVIVYLTKNKKSPIAEEYFNTLDDVNINVIEETPLDESAYQFLGGWPAPTTTREIYLQMLKSRSYLNTLIEETNQEYDRVIFSRMDVIYEKPVNDIIKDLDLSKTWIPEFHNWLGGYNDRFAVSNQENMFNYFSVYDNIDKYASEGHALHAESTLKYHLNKMNIPVEKFDIKFSRVRGDVEIVPSDASLQKNAHEVI